MKQVELRALTEKCVAHVKAGTFYDMPYKHLIVDNFLAENVIEQVCKNFPALDSGSWEFSDDEDIEIKYRTNWQSEFDIPEGIVDIVRVLNSSPFLRMLSDVFQIPKLIPDSYFTGGGLNAMKRGGCLDVHVDGNYHDATGLNRRLNVILFLNEEWETVWGGEFGVFDETGEKCVREIAPLFNRLVCFDTHDKSLHGVLSLDNAPESAVRKSLILYYYTKEARPDQQILFEKPHSALWKKKGLRDKRGNKSRKYS